MKHACGFCGATFNVLIMQWRSDRETYELRCDHHTRKEWPTVAAVDKSRAPGVGSTHQVGK